MSGLPWFKCYPRDFNDGMLGLTLEERGAYITILNVIYARGGPIDDDASYFRALLCCSPKAWSKIRASLIVKRKLFEVVLNGVPSLMNARAAVEIEENQEMRRKFSERGSKGGQKAQAVLKENKGLGQQQVDLGSTIEETDTEQILRPTVSCPAKPNAASDDFEKAWSAYPDKGRQRSLSKAKTRPYWRAAAKAAGGPERLLGAIERFKREDQTHKGEAGPKGFHLWLRDGRWEHWLPEANAPNGAATGMDPTLLALHHSLMNGTA